MSAPPLTAAELNKFLTACANNKDGVVRKYFEKMQRSDPTSSSYAEVVCEGLPHVVRHNDSAQFDLFWPVVQQYAPYHSPVAVALGEALFFKNIGFVDPLLKFLRQQEYPLDRIFHEFMLNEDLSQHPWDGPVYEEIVSKLISGKHNHADKSRTFEVIQRNKNWRAAVVCATTYASSTGVLDLIAAASAGGASDAQLQDMVQAHEQEIRANPALVAWDNPEKHKHAQQRIEHALSSLQAQRLNNVLDAPSVAAKPRKM